MYASHGVPVKALTNCCGENLAAAISVNERSTSGGLTIMPLLSTPEDLGMKTVLLAAKCTGRGPPSFTCLYALLLKLKAQPSSTPVETVWNPIGTWSRFLLFGHEFVKLVLSITQRMSSRSFLNVPQDGFIVVVDASRLQRAPERLHTNIHIVSCPIRLRFPEDGRLHR